MTLENHLRKCNVGCIKKLLIRYVLLPYIKVHMSLIQGVED